MPTGRRFPRFAVSATPSSARETRYFATVIAPVSLGRQGIPAHRVSVAAACVGRFYQSRSARRQDGQRPFEASFMSARPVRR